MPFSRACYGTPTPSAEADSLPGCSRSCACQGSTGLRRTPSSLNPGIHPSRSSRRVRRAAALRAAFLLCVCLGALPARAEARVRILVSQDQEPYHQAAAGLSRTISREVQGAALEVVELRGDAAQADAAAKKAKQDGVSLLATIGSLATQAAAREASGIPIVASLVLNAGELGRAPNVTGVTLEFPVETELRWIQKVLPGRKNVAILYSPEGSPGRVEAAQKAAPGAGLSLLTRKVDSPRDLPSALDSLTDRADVLWGVTDPVVLTPQTAKPILLFSLRNRIPFVGLSLNWVKAGALYALDRDYEDIGAQCGEMAAAILRGKVPSALPPAAPRKTVYSVNLKTARALRIDISQELLAGAQVVIE